MVSNRGTAVVPANVPIALTISDPIHWPLAVLRISKSSGTTVASFSVFSARRDADMVESEYGAADPRQLIALLTRAMIGSTAARFPRAASASETRRAEL